MKRRDFIRNTALLAAAAEMPTLARAAGNAAPLPQAEGEEENALITTAPALQNYAATSMGIAFGVSAMANGFVELSEQANMSQSRIVKCGGYRVTGMNPHVMHIRLTGLKPATTYYFRIGADRISYKGGYQMKVLRTEMKSTIYQFTTAGAQAKSHICVVNDTHSQWKAFGPVIDKVMQLGPACMVWNGDHLNSDESMDTLKQAFLAPPIAQRDFASAMPLLLCPGNHEDRSLESRHLENVWMYRQPEERPSRDWDLGRNFAIRVGDIALIGLDTAEDKLDTNPLLAGLFSSHEYRHAQAAWLQDALKQKEIKSAPHLVACCHIPLFDPDPKENPGDLAPADKHPDYSPDYASWQRTCANLWGPHLAKAGCQLVITAHQHRYRYDAPTADRPWAQIVGGGHAIEGTAASYPTVTEVMTQGKELVVRVHNVRSGQVQDEFRFKHR